MARWKRTVCVYPEFHQPGLEFPARRDAIVTHLQASGWPASNPAVAELVDELAEAQDADEFDVIWNEVYDHAYIDRTWIDTRGPAR